MVVAIHQPEHLPWLGFFDKAINADLLVLLDYVQYRKNYFQNRNKVRTKDGWAWITLPVKQPLMAPIDAIRIDLHSHLRRRYLSIIQTHYRQAPFWEAYFPAIRQIIGSEQDKLVDINCELIRFAFGLLGIKTPIAIASKLGVQKERGGTDVNLSICKFVGAKTYLSGVSGKEYLDCQRFTENGIQVRFQEFHHPVYRQHYDPFIPCMSVIDLLFNHGPASLDIIKGVGVERMDRVFE